MWIERESNVLSISGGATSPGAENRIIATLSVAPPEIIKRRAIFYGHAAPMELGESRSEEKNHTTWIDGGEEFRLI